MDDLYAFGLFINLLYALMAVGMAAVTAFVIRSAIRQAQKGWAPVAKQAEDPRSARPDRRIGQLRERGPKKHFLQPFRPRLAFCPWPAP